MAFFLCKIEVRVATSIVYLSGMFYFFLGWGVGVGRNLLSLKSLNWESLL